VRELSDNIELDKEPTHHIEVVVDRLCLSGPIAESADVRCAPA